MRHEQNRWGEHHSPFAHRIALRQFLAVKINQLGSTVKIQLHHKEILADIAVDHRQRKNIPVHPLAIDTATLLDQDHEALALGVGLVKILAQILEGLAHPVGLVQPVIAKLGRHHRPGQTKRRQHRKNPFHSSLLSLDILEYRKGLKHPLSNVIHTIGGNQRREHKHQKAHRLFHLGQMPPKL